MNKNAKRVMVGLIVVASALAAGCARNTDNAPPNNAGGTSGGGAQANAEAVYKQNCVSCHGDNLEGRLPGNTNLQNVGSRLSRDQIYNRILNGGNGMPAFNGTLSADQINALADWLSAKK